MTETGWNGVDIQGLGIISSKHYLMGKSVKNGETQEGRTFQAGYNHQI